MRSRSLRDRRSRRPQSAAITAGPAYQPVSAGLPSADGEVCLTGTVAPSLLSGLPLRSSCEGRIPPGRARAERQCRRKSKAPVQGVAAMPDTIRAQAQTHSHLPHVTLNSDGRRHPMLNSMTAITFIAGAAALVTGSIVSLHLPATMLGLRGRPVRPDDLRHP